MHKLYHLRVCTYTSTIETLLLDYGDSVSIFSEMGCVKITKIAEIMR